MEPESISGGGSGNAAEPLQRTSPTKQRRAKTVRRMSGRPPLKNPSIGSIEGLASLSKVNSGSSDNSGNHHPSVPSINPRRIHPPSQVISQIKHWLHHEKVRRAEQRQTTKDGTSKTSSATSATTSMLDRIHRHAPMHRKPHHKRSLSDVSEGTLALEELEQILAQGMSLAEETPMNEQMSPYLPPRRRPSKVLLRKQSTVGGSSDTDNRDLEDSVPSADVVLDNSKTLGYGGDATISQTNSIDPNKRVRREKDAWLQFKIEIVRLAHTLRLRGWRRFPINRGGEIDVVRLSGALTNAVYVVSPPASCYPTASDAPGSTTSLASRKPPSKLLLRIYGPQAEHLIDRDVELQILKRLAQKSIGPRLLGTFTNGRFEQYFNARTLTAQDLRKPETSKQIAKRMRELHDGIELLEGERDAGPFIWQNWDKWLPRCEEVMRWVDQEIKKAEQKTATLSSPSWKQRGLVCGTSWSFFKEIVDRYRTWLRDLYGNAAVIKRDLVFAHNDTQYGNLLRIQPSGESPLLIPANEHKQLVVIDFEYASANVPGLEFANHFTEWCYDYNAAEMPYGLKANRYPTPEEQRRFLEAYVQHRPFHMPPLSPTTSTTPSSLGPKSSISSFMLDSRAPPAQISEDENRREEAIEAEINRLMRETRIWRMANSAQWVAWGIVQATVSGKDDGLDGRMADGNAKSGETIDPSAVHENPTPPANSQNADISTSTKRAPDEGPKDETVKPLSEGKQETIEDENEEGFDYLGYAQERALFFWGDVLQFGIVKKEELPQGLLDKVKIVEY